MTNQMTTKIYEIYFKDCVYPIILTNKQFNKETIDLIVKYEKKCSTEYDYTEYVIYEYNRDAFCSVLDLKNKLLEDTPATAECGPYDTYNSIIEDIIRSMSIVKKSN